MEEINQGEVTMKVVKLHPDAVIPTRANESDAGLDLIALNDAVIPALGREVVGTGLAVAIPHCCAGLIWPRSGMAVKSGINVLAGVVDAGYRGEVKVALHNTDIEHDVVIRKGDRIAQLLIQRIEPVTVIEVGSLDDTERGYGGFGSSGQ